MIPKTPGQRPATSKKPNQNQILLSESKQYQTVEGNRIFGTGNQKRAPNFFIESTS